MATKAAGPGPLRAGDLVQVKSGGPKMTVEVEEQGDGKVYCTWFDGAKPMQRGFAPDTLVRLDD
jgi:uncharacterized protein YodC (DUF2158 family)